MTMTGIATSIAGELGGIRLVDREHAIGGARPAAFHAGQDRLDRAAEAGEVGGHHVDVARVVDDLRPMPPAKLERHGDAHVGHPVIEIRGRRFGQGLTTVTPDHEEDPATSDVVAKPAREARARGPSRRVGPTGRGAVVGGRCGRSRRGGRRHHRPLARPRAEPKEPEQRQRQRSERQAVEGRGLDADDRIPNLVDLAPRKTRFPAGQDGHLVSTLVQRSCDPVGPRIELAGGREHDHAALGHDLVWHGRECRRPCVPVGPPRGRSR
jgi:hypothetical protein